MMAVMQQNYTYRAEWDPERREYFARCLEFPGRYAEAFTAHEAIAALETVVTEALAEMAEFGQTPPDSLTDHRYSGRFLVRTSRMLHARLMVEAAEQGVTFNQWVVGKLTDRPVAFGFNDLFD
jgi:predicted HicB family RNase H-like nuclease